MPEYHPHGLTLSRTQIANMARGRRVRLAHHQMVGPHRVYLRKDQLAKMTTRHNKGSGYIIQMDPDQLAYHAKHGGSIFDTLKNWGRKALSAAQQFISPVASQLADSGMHFLQGEVVPRLQRKAVSMGDQLLSHGIDMVDRGLNRLGAGVKRRRRVPASASRYRHQHGEGFFDDVFSGLKSVANTVLPIVTPIAGQLIGKRLGLGLRRKRRGTGILAPGY